MIRFASFACVHAQKGKAESITIAAFLVSVAAVNVISAHAGGGVDAALRHILAVPLWVLPGWSLGRALFRRGTLSSAERLAVSGGLALAVLVVLGLALNALPNGLDHASWTWSLIGVTLISTSFGLVPMNGDTTEADHERLPAFRITAALVFALALMVVGFAFARHASSVHNATERFTEFWTLPDSALGSVRYGITNYEGHNQRYTLVVMGNGRRLAVVSAKPFLLRAGESHIGTFAVAPTVPRTLIVDLYRAGASQAAPYRSTTLHLQ